MVYKFTEFKTIILRKIPMILGPILNLISYEQMDIRISAERTSQLLLDIMEKVKNDSIEFMSLFNVVKDMLNKKDNTAEQALVWMDHLLRIYSEKLLPTIDGIL